MRYVVHSSTAVHISPAAWCAASRCVLASRLSEVRGWRVLLLEEGPEEPPQTAVPGFFNYALLSALTDKLLTRGQRNSAVPLGATALRGRLLGGTSAISGMVYDRGSRHDWDRLAHLGWGFQQVRLLQTNWHTNRYVPGRLARRGFSTP